MKLRADSRTLQPRGLSMARLELRGLTLIELIIATGLTSLVVVALVAMSQTSLSVWGRTESRRDLLEQATAISELVTNDLNAMEAGQRGDLLIDWAAFDSDGDGLGGVFHPRLRLVRRVSAAELSRRGLLVLNTEDGAAPATRASALLEVAWLHLPGEIGSLYRSERVIQGEYEPSIFDADFFDARGLPAESAASEVSNSILWFGVVVASQTSDLTEGWTVGEGLLDCGVAWDARTSGRLDEDLTALNALPSGCPKSDELPVFPRRIRIEIEIERQKDLGKRTTLVEPMDIKTTRLILRDERFAPPEGGHLRLGEEWMEIVNVDGRRLTVVRGVRGTRSLDHPAGGLIHYGARTVREMRIPAYREDWNL